MPSEHFTLSYEGLSADCAKVFPDLRGTREKIDEAAVRACLEAFAMIPAVDLVDCDAKVRLRHFHRHIAITRAGDLLSYVEMPEASHTAAIGSPAEVLDFLTGRQAAALAQVSAPVGEEIPVLEPVRQKSLFKLPVSAQIALLAVLGSVLVALAYRQFIPPPPSGYVFIADSARIKELKERYAGDYGVPTQPGSLCFRVDGATLSIFQVATDGKSQQLIKAEPFHYALRGQAIGLLGGNGDILEFDADGNLLFGELSYPRQGVPATKTK